MAKAAKKCSKCLCPKCLGTGKYTTYRGDENEVEHFCSCPLGYDAAKAYWNERILSEGDDQ